MKNIIKSKISGILKRIQCLKYGIIYLRSSRFSIPSTLWINLAPKKLIFLSPNNSDFIYEFNEICLNDCYNLKALKKELKDIKVIVDIGANQGLFVIAARQNFSNASIHAYEPNDQLKFILNQNLQVLKAMPYYEAVTRNDCKVLLNFGATDLHTTAMNSAEGQVVGTSFRKIINRAGGKIDVLKIDCEGGEWELLEDKGSWINVRSVTMEYHLWAKEGSTVESLIKILNMLGFRIIENKRLSNSFGLITGIKF